MNNKSYPGREDENLEAKAISILLRDHLDSDRLDEALRRISYGFSKDCGARQSERERAAASAAAEIDWPGIPW